MILARRILPFIGTLLMIAGYAGVIFQPLQWIEWLVALGVFALLSLLFMMRWRWNAVETWFAAFPILTLLIGGTGMLFFVEGLVLRCIAALALSIIYGVYMENLFTLHFQPSKYTSLSLPKMSLVLNVITAFFLFSTAFALQLIGLIPFWIISVIALLFGCIHMAYMLRGFNVAPEKHRGFVLFVGILFAESITAIGFLPTGFYVDGLFAAIMVYFLTTFSLMIARDAFTKRQYIEQVVLTAVMIAVLFATAQWT